MVLKSIIILSTIIAVRISPQLYPYGTTHERKVATPTSDLTRFFHAEVEVGCEVGLDVTSVLVFVEERFANCSACRQSQ